MSLHILTINNPGSTSTKTALVQGEHVLLSTKIKHAKREPAP